MPSMPKIYIQSFRQIMESTLSAALCAYLFPGLCSSVAIAAMIGVSMYLGQTVVENMMHLIGFDNTIAHYFALGFCLSLTHSYFHVKMTSILLMLLSKDILSFTISSTLKTFDFSNSHPQPRYVL